MSRKLRELKARRRLARQVRKVMAILSDAPQQEEWRFVAPWSMKKSRNRPAERRVKV